MNEKDRVAHLQQKIWEGSIPLCIKLSPDECRTYNDSFTYMIQYPRLSYLPFLLPRLHAFFSSSLVHPDSAPNDGWFSHDSVPLKWQHPLGLLYDLFSGAPPYQAPDPKSISPESTSPRPPRAETLPWHLTLHFTHPPPTLLPLHPHSGTSDPDPLTAIDKTTHDAFINSVKEADHLRNGTARAIMSLSVDDGAALWKAVKTHDLRLFNGVNDRLLVPAAGERLRHVPLRVFLPGVEGAAGSAGGGSGSGGGTAGEGVRGSVRVVQMLIPPFISVGSTGAGVGASRGRGEEGEKQTLGTALHSMLPTVFPSRRSYIHAQAVLHGVVVPLSAPLEELMRGAAYCDGFLGLGVVMVG